MPRRFLAAWVGEGFLENAFSVRNVILLFLYSYVLCFQVFDIVIQRFLELSPVYKSLESLLDHLGCLYKFHGLFLHFII